MADQVSKRRFVGLSRAGVVALAAALASLPFAATAATGPEPAAGAAASRWTLPPPNLGLRSAALGGVSRMEQVLSAQGSISPVPASGRAARPSFAAAWREPASDRPNVFGSIALAVANTPLDEQWRRATAESPPAELTRRLPALDSDDEEAVVRTINRWVNAQVAFVDDADQYDRADRWTGAEETLRRGRGDCEDYALTKMQLLAGLGFDADRMFLVVVHDTLRRDDHAVLIVRLGDRFVVLDNLHDVVVETGALSSYRPIISYSAAGRWVHGFPVVPPPSPVELAAVGTTAP